MKINFQRLGKIPGLGLALVLMIWVGIGFELHRAHDSQIREAELATLSRARVFAEYSANLIKRIDEVILDMRTDWHGDWKSFAQEVRHKQEVLADVSFQVAVIGPDGIMQFSNLSKPDARVDLSEREHFKIHQQHPGRDELFISKALLGKVSGKWSIQFTRPIHTRGKFSGVFVVSVSPDLFANFADKLQMQQPSDLMSVLRDHREVVARFPKDYSKLGIQIVDRPFQRSDSPLFGNYRAQATTDGVERIFAYAKLPQHGFTFLIGESKDQAMKPFWTAARMVIAAGVLVTALIGVLLWGLNRQFMQLQRTRENLTDALQKARAAGVAKSRFLANMSHEFRTPLHGVHGAIELLQTTALSKEQEGLVRTAQTSAGLLLSVIDDVLDYSKLESGKLSLESSEYDLRRSVEDVVCMLAPRAHNKRISIAAHVLPEVPTNVLGDSVRLRQILTNLLGNAIKFTHVGEVVVHVSCPKDDPQGMLLFEVTDTGIGIQPQKLDSLFTPFTQADDSTSRQFGGTGLGLSIAKYLVNLAGGRIGVRSEPGKGSAFWFTWPSGRVERGTSPLDSVSVHAQELQITLLGHPGSHLSIVETMLDQWGLKRVTCHSDEQAWTHLHNLKLHTRGQQLLILDLGFERDFHASLIQRMSSSPPVQDVPVLVLSVQSLANTPLSHLKVGLLSKPLRQSDLLDAIMNITQGQVANERGLREGEDMAAFAGAQCGPVLFVEDNAITRELGLQMLLKVGLQVDVAVNGAQAVDMYKTGKYTHVLMDIQMPVMDGLQATRQIRAWEQGHGIAPAAIIAVTAHAQNSDKAESLAAGMNDHVTKPYSQSVLLKALLAQHVPRPESVPEMDVPEPVMDVRLDEARLAEIQNLMGEGFLGLLSQARNLLAQTGEDMDKLVSDGDLSGACELVHRIKNNAGDVGATDLREIASAVERQLIEQQLDLASLSLMQQKLHASLKAIDGRLAQNPT